MRSLCSNISTTLLNVAYLSEESIQSLRETYDLDSFPLCLLLLIFVHFTDFIDKDSKDFSENINFLGLLETDLWPKENIRV